MDNDLAMALAALFWAFCFIAWKIGTHWHHYHKFGKGLMVTIWIISWFVGFYILANA